MIQRRTLEQIHEPGRRGLLGSSRKEKGREKERWWAMHGMQEGQTWICGIGT